MNIASALLAKTHLKNVKMMKISIVSLIMVAVTAPLAEAQPEMEVAVESLSVDGRIHLETEDLFARIRSSFSYARHFELDASAMTVIMEHNYATYPELQASSENASAEVIYTGPGSIVTEEIRKGHYTTVIAINSSASITSSDGEIIKKSGEKMTREDGYTKERQKETFYVGPQFRIQNLYGKIAVTGTFDFTMYEWDGTIVGSNGTQSFWTGERHHALGPMQQVPEEVPLGEVRNVGGQVEWQTAFVYVENGTLEVGVSTEKDGNYIYMGDSKGTLFGNIRITKSSNDNPGNKITNLDGEYLAKVWVPTADHLSLSVSPYVPGGDQDRPTEAPTPGGSTDRPGQASLAPASTSAPALPDAGLPALTSLLVVPTLLVTAVAVVRPVRRMRRLEDAFDLGLHAYVLRHAPPLLRSRRFGVEASMMYTVALLDERGPDAAEAHLRGVRPARRPAGAMYEYLMARIRAAQTRFDEARIHVHACLAEEQAFLIEVRQQPSLRFLARPAGDVGEGYA